MSANAGATPLPAVQAHGSEEAPREAREATALVVEALPALEQGSRQDNKRSRENKPR